MINPWMDSWILKKGSPEILHGRVTECFGICVMFLVIIKNRWLFSPGLEETQMVKDFLGKANSIRCTEEKFHFRRAFLPKSSISGARGQKQATEHNNHGKTQSPTYLRSTLQFSQGRKKISVGTQHSHLAFIFQENLWFSSFYLLPFAGVKRKKNTEKKTSSWSMC